LLSTKRERSQKVDLNIQCARGVGWLAPFAAACTGKRFITLGSECKIFKSACTWSPKRENFLGAGRLKFRMIASR
jgi:hypothetical protein